MLTLSALRSVLSVSAEGTRNRVRSAHASGFHRFTAISIATLLLLVATALTGCGSGGYAGGGVASLSTSAMTIDAGQSFNISAVVNGGVATWTLSGANCTGSGCGTLSTQEGSGTTYSAPSGLTSQLKVTITASIAGTQSKQVANVTINPDPVISGTPPPGTVGVPYSTTLSASGGTRTLTWSVAGGSLPAGLTFNTATGVISGTPTAVGTSVLKVQIVDQSDIPFTVSANESVTISLAAAALTLSGNPPSGTVGVPYSTSLQASGGTAPYTYSVISGTLPGGLALGVTSGTIVGTPTTAGSSVFTAQVQDSTGLKASAVYGISIVNGGATLTLVNGTLPNGVVGTPYSATIGVSGGTAPYTCAFIAGTLPAGLSLNGCVVSGTPTAAIASNLTVKATDSATPANTVTGPESITITAGASLTIASPPGGTVGVPYTGLIPVSGGSGPYTCSITAGTLPSGLTLSGCTISGTTTVSGSTAISIKATDSSSPVISGSAPITLVFAPAPLSITSGTLPGGTVGVAYSSTIGVSGGTSPYTCTITAGTLPAGLAMGANCLVSGTPTTAGTSSLTVKATDTSNPTLNTSGPISITIVAAPVLVISSPPSGTVGVVYTGTIPVSGGTGPYTCKLTSGTLPAGLTLASSCAVTGTPTSPGNTTVTVQATDSKTPGTTSTGPVTFTINPAALAISTGTLPNGTVGIPYSATIGVTGGTAPYTCSFTSGTLPAGLALGANCVVSGTPTVAGSVNLVVKATDSGNPTLTATGPVGLTINPAPLAISTGTLPNGTVGVPYSATIGVTGGTAPYTCSFTSGTLPAGLALGANCVVSGTPTVAGSVNLVVKATDSGNPTLTATGPVGLTINPAPLAISTGTLPNGTVGVPYSATIGVTGGTAPYTCTFTSGTLPAGLALGANCVVSGTPTVAGSVNLVVKATDSGNPTLTATGPVGLTINPAPLAISTGTLPNGTVGVPYSATIGVTGGTAPYTCSFTSGTLPAGLALGANCVVSGTPTVAGSVNLVVKATDSGNPTLTATGPVGLTINPAPLAISTGTLPNGTVGVPYSATIGVTGGTAPYTCTFTSGTLPAGLALGANCVVSGTPTVAGSVNLVVKATDSSNPTLTATGPVALTINPAALAITPGNLPNGTVGVPYSATIGVTGGTAPYTCTFTSGTLPAGLALGANCVVSGTPTVAGSVNLAVKATDSGNPTLTATGPVGLTINPAPLAISTGTLPNGTVGVPYSATIGVTGGTAPYTCTFTSGTLPAGLALGANCVVSGTPTVAGSVNLVVKATDSGNPTLTANGPVGLTINPAPLAISTGTLPNGTVGVPYSATIGVTGGTAPYTCTFTSGTLPAGLTLGANCVVSGTPTLSGSVSLVVKATDSSNPTLTATGPVGLTINPAALAISTGNLPNGTVGVPYSATIGVTGGTAPYTCTFTSGTLPSGLTLGANCVVSGIPLTSGTVTLGVKATDSGNPTLVANGPVGLTINPIALSILVGILPNGTVGVPYSSTIPVSGGTAPYTCTLTAGTLPAGLSLGANCGVTGTPTVAGTSVFTVKATDAGNPTLTTTGVINLTILPAPAVLIIGNPPHGTTGAPYTGVIPITGGTGPYNCTLLLGTLPPGLTLNGCTITGTPITSGSTPVTIGVVDSSNPPTTGTGIVTITIDPATAVLTLGNPPAATVGAPYTGLIPVGGGTGPYTCTLNSGTVPAGLTLTNCTLTGTPTAPVTATLNITATDSSNPKGTITGPVVVTVNPVNKLTLNGSLPNGIVGVAYTQTLQAAGGVAPYSYALTAGALPAGLTLSTGGVISGTPTTPGASSFTVTVTDTENPAQTASLPLVLLITYPTTPNDGELKGPYAFLFQGYDDSLIGVLAYQTATVGSFTADGTGVVANGELDANHQASNPTGATIASNPFLGTYTLGTDNRGFLTITTLNTDGTVGRTSTYAISVKAPVAPATTTAQGSLIEYDGNQLRGTKGSGTLLQQTATAFTNGLVGSYAFGLSGDTPCLPTCTVGVIAGPAASVGQFTVSNGTVAGSSDANIASAKFSNLGLSGTYGAADGNGRIQLTMPTAGMPGVYPSDYAVYLVDANHAFLLSTDKHSASILLAGSAESQTVATFSNASLNGPFIGYENAATNPGLVGATLTNVTNLSTATIFRATGDTGTCTVTNVDTGGATQLVNGLTGLGSGAPIINALLGTYQSLGAASCPVSANGRTILNYPAPNTALSILLGTLGLGNTAPPARVVYLASPNRGYFLETGYAGLGRIEAQTGQPYDLSSFSGTYVYGEAPASSVATINASGFIVANGNGAATSTEDLNVGVGTLNVLQLGVNYNDTYTKPDSTTGRFLLNNTTLIDTSAVYVISPGRFVLLDTNPATTSPSVTVLY